MISAVFLPSCISLTHQKQDAFQPRFFIEAVGAELKSSKILSVQLPVSASVIQIKPVPSIPEFEIESVAVEQGNMGKYLQFKLKNKARLQLMSMCGEYRGRRLVLVLGQDPIGAWRINKILDNGSISTYVEIPDESLDTLAKQINDALSMN